MHVLEQRLADLLGDAAVQLAERGRLVDDPPEVVDTGDALDPHLAGVGVDLDLHGVGAVREGGVQPLEVELGDPAGAKLAEIGRAPGRGRVCQDVWCSLASNKIKKNK